MNKSNNDKKDSLDFPFLSLSRRRDFLSRALRYSSVFGLPIVFSKNMPLGLIPIALSKERLLAGKHSDLSLLSDRPISLETPAHLLDDKTTPANRLFVRNNGLPPQSVDLASWRLRIEGPGVQNSKSYSMEQLKGSFESVSYQLTLECAGNGREEFTPSVGGNQWTTGAVGCPMWTGVRLRDVLMASGVRQSAVYIGYYGSDTHLSGDPSRESISRGVPIKKALKEDSLLAFSMNGTDLPFLHGYPLRLIFGGWPGSTSGKWLKRIFVRNDVHNGHKMNGYSYKIPCQGVSPGSDVAEKDMCIIEEMPVKSLVTFPRSGVIHSLDRDLEVRGHAWSGDSSISKMHISTDFGQTWIRAKLNSPVNINAWQHWSSSISFPQKGYYEIWARATDKNSKTQPMVLPGWNPRGYLNNACHRVAVSVV